MDLGDEERTAAMKIDENGFGFLGSILGPDV